MMFPGKNHKTIALLDMKTYCFHLFLCITMCIAPPPSVAVAVAVLQHLPRAEVEDLRGAILRGRAELRALGVEIHGTDLGREDGTGNKRTASVPFNSVTKDSGTFWYIWNLDQPSSTTRETTIHHDFARCCRKRQETGLRCTCTPSFLRASKAAKPTCNEVSKAVKSCKMM